MHSPIRRILITAFCQTPGLASAMKLLFPGVEVFTRAALEKKNAKAEDVAHLLGQIDVWINIEAGDEFFAGGAFAASHPALTYISIPLIEFAAFHPDVCHAQAHGVRTEYTSALAVWAYKSALPPAQAAALFNHATFANLGYLSEWARSTARLRQAFAASHMAADFERFYLRIKRFGLFMYSATHPRAAVLAELAKLIALRLGHDAAVRDADLPTLDALSHFIWPVYPDIAENLSLPSSGYVWQWGDGTRIRGLVPFLTYSFEQYRAKGLAPTDITIPGVDLARLGRAVAA